MIQAICEDVFLLLRFETSYFNQNLCYANLDIDKKSWATGRYVVANIY